jgi:hypothetical protein
MANSDYASGNVAPAARHAAVTPSNTVGFGPARALYIGVTGNVAVVDLDGNAVTYVGVTGGSILPIQCTRVNATGTTATNIVVMF